MRFEPTLNGKDTDQHASPTFLPRVARREGVFGRVSPLTPPPVVTGPAG